MHVAAARAQLGAPFEVSLNNQDYTASNLTFSIYPPPSVALLTPDRGGADGGISVLLNGSGLVDGGADPYQCRFGAEVVAGTMVAPHTMRCVAPSAAAAGAETMLQFDFDPEHDDAHPHPRVPPLGTNEAEYTLHGAAMRTDDGALMLTSCDYEQAGSFVVRRPAGKSGAVSAFHATFDVWVGGGSGGDGFAFCYGALAPGSDGGVGRDGRFVGVTKGLCVRFATRDGATPAQQSVELVRDGKVVRSVDVAGGTADAGSAGGAPHATAIVDGHVDTLRTDGWVPVEVEVTPSFGLTATFNGRRFFDRQRLDGWGGESYDAKRGWGGHKWAPADGWGGDDGWGKGWRPKADWRFVVGAHTSSWTDRHVIDTLRLRLGALVDASDVMLEMSANGQQFTASGNPFAYFPTPFVSFATPAAGPAAGGTLVAVVGARLGTSEQLHCRFNGSDAVTAS